MPSFDMSVEFAFQLAKRVNELTSRADVAGVVVTHGTDTMEETSFLTDLLLQSDKPVVFTGAQRAHDDPQSDGPFNLLNSIRLAASPLARGLGATVCFNGSVHAARDVTKVHASAVETFQSYDRGAIAEVDKSVVVIHRRPCLRRSFVVDDLEHRVGLYRLTLGADMNELASMIERDPAGLVIEAFGRGNGPSALSEHVRLAVKKGAVVLITSRCPAGRVEPIYGGGGGGRDLADAGGIFVGDLKGPKARLLLMVLLSDEQTRHRISTIVKELAP
jgi:L-asparaginase